MNASAHPSSRLHRPPTGTSRRCALAGLALCALAFTAIAQTAAPLVSGDLIVKFRDSSQAGAALSAVVLGQRPLASTASLAKRLSKQLGVPLTLVQVTSGREALLAIDRVALLRTLAQRAAREPGVARVTPIDPAAPGLPAQRASLRIELKPQASAQALATRLASGDLLRPQLHTDSTGATLLSYDIASLTLALLERLGRQSDVEYTQANRMLSPVAPSSPR